MSRGAARRRSYGPRQRELKRRAILPIDAPSDVESAGRIDEAGESLIARRAPAFARFPEPRGGEAG